MARQVHDELVFKETTDFASMRKLALQSGLEDGAFDDFVKAFGFYRDSELVACAGLRVQEDLFTVECVAVAQTFKGRGIGRVLVRRIEEEARLRGAVKIWAIARAPAFFEKIGYVRVQPGESKGPTLKACMSCQQYKKGCEPAIVAKIL